MALRRPDPESGDVGNVGSLQLPSSVPRSSRAPRLIAAAVAASGVITLASAAFSPAPERIAVLWRTVPLGLRAGASSVAALAGIGTLIIAGALARRQRRAWAVAIGLLLVATVSHLLKDLDTPSAGVSLGMAVVLALARSEFYARPGPGSARRTAVALPSLALLVWGFGTVAILAHGSEMVPRPTFGSALVAAVRGAVGLPLGFRTVGETGRWVPALLPLLGVLVVASSLVLLFRPAV